MPEILAVDVDPAGQLEISISGQSPHVFAYRFWHKAPGENDWTKLAEGQTADAAPDVFTAGPFATGTLVAWWIAVSGHGETHYRVLVSFAQNGATVNDGVVTHEGTTSANGGAAIQHNVVLT